MSSEENNLRPYPIDPFQDKKGQGRLRSQIGPLLFFISNSNELYLDRYSMLFYDLLNKIHVDISKYSDVFVYHKVSSWSPTTLICLFVSNKQLRDEQSAICKLSMRVVIRIKNHFSSCWLSRRIGDYWTHGYPWVKPVRLGLSLKKL